MAVARAPTPAAFGTAQLPPVPDHAGLAQRERDEDTDRVQRNEIRNASAEGHDQQRREQGEDDDARREREAVPAEVEVMRREAIAGQDAAESRKVGEGCVGSEHQQQCGRDLDEVVVGSAIADERPRELTHDRLLLRRIGDDPELACEKAHAEEYRAEKRAHEDEDDLGVPRLGPLERGHAVGDGLHSGERDRAGRESAEHEKQPEGLDRFLQAPLRGRDVMREGCRREPEQPVGKESEDRHEVDICRKGEDRRALADSTEVPDREEYDERDAKRHAHVEELREDRRQRGHTGRDRDRHREHVVGEERSRGGQTRERPEVVARHDVRAATVRVCPDRLLIAHHDDGEDDDDREGDREGEGGHRAEAREQEHSHDLFGGVRRRGDVVRSENGKSLCLADAFL